MLFQAWNESWRNQFFYVIIVNLTTFTFGNIFGWLSSTLLALKFENISVELEGMDILIALGAVGSLLGLLLSEPMTIMLGTRVTLAIMAFSQLIFWLLVAFGDQYWYLLLVGGFSGGNLFKVIPLYVAEISQDDIRGRLGLIFPIFFNIGALFSYIAATHFRIYIAVMSILPASYILLVMFVIPETPLFLLKTNSEEEAFAAFLSYRTKDINKFVPDSTLIGFNDLQDFQLFLQKEQRTFFRSCKAFFKKDARFGLGMSLFLVILYHCSGVLVLTQYTAKLFLESNLSVSDSEICMGVTQVFGNCVAFVMVDRFGRKVLLVISYLVAALFFSLLGIFLYLNEYAIDGSHCNLIPIISLCLAIFGLSIGIGAIPFTVMTEILLPEIRSMAMTVITAIGFMGGTIVLFVVPIIATNINLCGLMWTFASFCLVGLLVVNIFLPETKGKKINVP